MQPYMEALVDALAITDSDDVLEIGFGLGEMLGAYVALDRKAAPVLSVAQLASFLVVKLVVVPHFCSVCLLFLKFSVNAPSSMCML